MLLPEGNLLATKVDYGATQTNSSENALHFFFARACRIRLSTAVRLTGTLA
jgi:hypothetical protein